MKKLSSIGVIAFGALVTGLAVVGMTAPVQAYPETSIDVTVSSDTVYSGQSFSAKAESNGTTCDWSLKWNGTIRTGTSSTGHPFVTSFTAPQVQKERTIALHATCFYDASGTSNGRGTDKWDRTIDITVKPAQSSVDSPRSHTGSAAVAGPKAGAGTAGPAGSDLPNTGGPNLVFLLGGLVLLASGTTAVTLARRRAAEAEIQAFRA